MSDSWLLEQHTSLIAQRQPEPEAEPETDENASWVMLSQTGDIVKLPHERMRHTVGPRIRLDLSVPESLRARSTDFSIRSDNGTAYITNQRLIYIPSKSTEEFKSFATPILNLENSHISSSLFGSWYWVAEVKPVSQGGVPPDIVRLELRLTFKDGGHLPFQQKFEEIKERLHQLREVERASGHRLNVLDEPLPAYVPREEEEAAATAGSSRSLAPEPSIERSTSTGSQNPRAPDEPPPGYDEAQAQAISVRLEDHIREEANRQ